LSITQPTFIADTISLEDFCSRTHKKSPIAFDTEFVRERTYYPRLEIFQLATEDEIVVVDCQAIEDLSPLWDLLSDPSTEKVVHSGQQDMELVLQLSGSLPAPVVDTQVAASLLGLGAQCGYGRLVHQVLRKAVPKGLTFSDWTRRPLHPDQLEYAKSDVEHLLSLRNALLRRLVRRDRMEWLREECEYLTDPATYRKHPPERCFLKIKGRSGLDPTSLSVLRSLAQWREFEAMRRDLPPGRILKDYVLLAIAKARPTGIEDLKRQRGIHGGQIGREGSGLIQAVREGLARAEKDPVRLPEKSGTRLDGDQDGLLKVLSAVLQIQADRAEIAPSVLATSPELCDLVSAFANGELNGVRLLKGWRRRLAGEMLLDVLQGKVGLRFNPERGSLVLERIDG